MADTWVQVNLKSIYQEKNTWPEILNSRKKLVQGEQESLKECHRNRQIKQKGGNGAAED